MFSLTKIKLQHGVIKDSNVSTCVGYVNRGLRGRREGIRLTILRRRYRRADIGLQLHQSMQRQAAARTPHNHIFRLQQCIRTRHSCRTSPKPQYPSVFQGLKLPLLTGDQRYTMKKSHLTTPISRRPF